MNRRTTFGQFQLLQRERTDFNLDAHAFHAREVWNFVVVEHRRVAHLVSKVLVQLIEVFVLVVVVLVQLIEVFVLVLVVV